MPRAIWSGSISFGLVNIPVKLYSAIGRRTVRFNQLDGRSNTRIKQKRVSSLDGSEVPPEQLVRGYEVAKGNYVVVSDDELSSLQPVEQQTIDIEEFVDLSRIDPIYYDNAYYLAPDRAAAKPYALLVAALEGAGKVAVAHFVMRQRRHLAAIRPQGGHLLMSTMVYADEVHDPAELPEMEDLDRVELSERELDMARQLIESLGEDFEPGRYRDTYREAVQDLLDRKAAGEAVVVAPTAPTPEKVVDLMAALEASVAAAKDARSRHPTAHEGPEPVEGGDEERERVAADGDGTPGDAAGERTA